MSWLTPFGRDVEKRLDLLREEFNRLVDRFLEDGVWKPDPKADGFLPVINLREKAKEYVVEAELPGVEPDEVEIEVAGNLLTIRGEKKFEKEEQSDSIHTIERRYGAFKRTIRLPDNARTDGIQAESKNGGLYIRIPKSKESAAVRKIRVQKKDG